VLLNRDVSCKVYLREKHHFLSKISLCLATPCRDKFPPKGLDFQKDRFYHTILISELFKNHLRYAQIDNQIILEHNAFGRQQTSLSLNTAKRVCSGKLSLGIDHPVTRNMLRIRIVMKNIPHYPGKIPISQMQSDLPIGGNLSFGNVPHKFIHLFFHRRNFQITRIC